MPAFADIFIDAFHHNDQVTPGHGVRTGGRIIGGYLEGAFFKQFLIKDSSEISLELPNGLKLKFKGSSGCEAALNLISKIYNANVLPK